MGRRSTRREIRLSDADRERLGRIMSHPRSVRKHAWRARIVMEPGSGCGLVETMRRTGMSKPTVRRWWDRFLAEGWTGCFMTPPVRRGRRRSPGTG